MAKIRSEPVVVPADGSTLTQRPALVAKKIGDGAGIALVMLVAAIIVGVITAWVTPPYEAQSLGDGTALLTHPGRRSEFVVFLVTTILGLVLASVAGMMCGRQLPVSPVTALYSMGVSCLPLLIIPTVVAIVGERVYRAPEELTKGVVYQLLKVNPTPVGSFLLVIALAGISYYISSATGLHGWIAALKTREPNKTPAGQRR